MPITTGMLLGMIKQLDKRIRSLEKEDDTEVVYHSGGGGTFAPSIRLKSKTPPEEVRDN